jgi:phospholipase C
MGYYERSDLEFHYALADAFTICDRYYCSVLGPTDPNRLYTMSASLGPSGAQGGPILTTSSTRIDRYATLSWPTMPEQLSAAGVSWKVYGALTGDFGDNVLPYFKQYWKNPALRANALGPRFPSDFQNDCAQGTLPQVSWVLAGLLQSEHPPAPVEWGQHAAATVLEALTSNPALWAKTALFITFDENGGFFDHVPPPVAPPGTAGEYLTVSPLPSDAEGVAGPIGLGFRVPMLIASPFARGGFVSSDVFDHTSTLRFLETRFGAEVPNLSAWRRSVTGDLTSAFNFATVDDSVPTLPAARLLDPRILTCVATAGGKGYPIPPNGGIPPQEPGVAVRPSGPVAGCAT